MVRTEAHGVDDDYLRGVMIGACKEFSYCGGMHTWESKVDACSSRSQDG